MALWSPIARILGEYVALYASSIGAFIVAGMTASVPYAGPILTPALAFFAVVVAARLFGEACGRALFTAPPSKA